MQHFTLKISIAVLAISITAVGGEKQGSRNVKHLPLDGVPGAILKNRTNSQYLPDHIVVKLMPQVVTSLSKSAFGIESIDRVLSRAMGIAKAQMFPTAPAPQKAGDVDLSLLYSVAFSSPNDPFALAEELSRLPEVQYAEPWFIYPLAERTFTPNDSLYSFQWALSKVNAPAAWDITLGDSTVVIAIVDSGVRWMHPDLAANVWVNPGETGFDAFMRDKQFNGVDDDSDGYVDDWHGWDFVGADYATYNPGTTKGDNDPAPTGSNNDHGTHVAGIVAAVTNNSIGVASLAPRCRILPIKCTADNDTRGNGDAYILAGYQGIVYAAMMGANIINCSWGGNGGAQAEQDIIDFVTQHGSLVVAAAGNENADAFFSPASYRNVLSVAATDQYDYKAGFSNYGDNVDVCAPGVNIWSTFFKIDPKTSGIVNSYDFLSGTSMASPLAAALAALVKSKNPSYTGLQVGEQVRVTCDNIDARNAGLTGRLGRGRINALQALTVTNLPSMRLQAFTVSDFPGGNRNSVPEPAETLNVVCSYKNFLVPTSPGATVRLTTDSPYLTVIQGTEAFPVPSVGTLDSINNKTAPIRVYVQSSVPQSYMARLRLTFSDGSFNDAQSITFLINPTYASHNINAVRVTLTNNGKIGFFDYPDNHLGIGFIFNGANHLFEGGLILGTSPTQVVNVVRNEKGNTQDADFTSRDFYTLRTPGAVSQQDGFASFNDSTASPANRVGLQVKMQSYAFSDPVDSKYIILQYDITNLNKTPVSNLYAGIFLDWDIGNTDQEIAQNYSRYDATRSLGYAFSGRPDIRREYLGIRALDSASSFRSLVNTPSIDLSRTAKWDWISGGFKIADAGPADIHQLIASGPYTIGTGAARKVAFALVAGDSSLANLRQNSDAAKAKWLKISKTVGITDEQPVGTLTFGLAQNYPNPFNPTTNFEFRLPACLPDRQAGQAGISNFGFVKLQVFDILGREVALLVNEVRQPGVYHVRWDASALPSGVYLYQLKAGSSVMTKRMILLK